MERLTSKRANGIKTGYWSTHNKDELIQRLGPYEDIGYSPEAIREAMRPEKDGGWISVEDRLPEDYTLVLCYTLEGQDILFHTDPIGWTDGEYVSSYVTHWRPLPDPPRRRAR